MRSIVTATCFTIGLSPLAAAAPLDRVDFEIAAEKSVGASAQRAWFERIKKLGVGGPRIRQAGPNESPEIRVHTSNPPRYKVIAILTRGDQLALPGRAFTSRDAAKLENYLTRLLDEGVEGVTADRGTFGLTKKQFDLAHADMSQPIATETLGRPAREVIEQIASTFAGPVELDATAAKSLDAVKVRDELNGFTAGTGLAILLRAEGLALRPSLVQGKLVHRVVAAPPSALGELAKADSWTIGHEPDARVRELAPSLLETVQVQIDGYTLNVAIDALRERIGVPILFDHLALKKNAIDPTKIEVKYPSRKTIYKSLLNNLLFQAKLRGELRIDEAGKAFYWVTVRDQR